MSQQRIQQCPLGLTSAELSSWRAQGVGQADARRIEAHVRTCAACHAHLAAYDRVDTVLRTQRLPAPPAVGWQSLLPQLGKPHAGQTPARGRLVHHLAIAAAIFLVVAGFAGIFIRLSASGSGQATPAPLALPWLGGDVPRALADQYTLTNWNRLPVTASDGETFYGCEIASGGGTVPEVWVSHDRAVHWKMVHALPIVRSDIRLCYLVVDMVNPAIIEVVVAWPPVGNRPTGNEVASFVSYNGGTSWQALADTQAYTITRLATHQETTYALFGGSGGAEPHLMASANRMRTWHTIDSALTATGQRVLDFVVGPGGSALLAQVGKDGTPTRQFWASGDGGQSWTRLPAPTAEQYSVQAAQPGKPWAICAGQYDTSRVESAPNRVFCSTDGGQHWIERPGLNGALKVSVPVAGHPLGRAPAYLVALAGDGALIALDQGPTPPVLYRLAAGARVWQSLGPLPLPVAVVGYSTGPGSGMLWVSGAGHEPVEPQRMIFTARYP